jgi:hypothetical protein
MDEKDQTIAELRQQIVGLFQRIQQLEEHVARLQKDSNNSSKSPKVPGRRGQKQKRGAQPGHTKCTRQPFEPDQVDDIIEYELNDYDAQGLESLDTWSVIQQVTLPRNRYIVTEHRARWAQALLAGLQKLFGTLHHREKMTVRGCQQSMEKINPYNYLHLHINPKPFEGYRISSQFKPYYTHSNNFSRDSILVLRHQQ